MSAGFTEYTVSAARNERDDIVVVEGSIFDDIAKRLTTGFVMPPVIDNQEGATVFKWPAHPEKDVILGKTVIIGERMIEEGIMNVRVDQELHEHQILA